MKNRYRIACGILLAACMFAAACSPAPQPSKDETGNQEQTTPGQTTPEPPKADREPTAYASPDVTLTLGEVAEGSEGEISNELFGVFLEDINYATQALSDDLVINGCFESRFQSNKKYGWSGDGASITVVTTDGVAGSEFEDYKGNIAGASNAEITVTKDGGSVSNAGFVPVPMAVEKDVEYVFSAFIKTASAQSLTVSVTDGTQVYAQSEEIELESGGQWVKYVRTLKATSSCDSGLRLTLTFSHEGTVFLDGVSFKTTDSTVGIKNYLYDAIKELSPKFVRFPGGCIIEGENIDQAYDWKNSIGAVAVGSDPGEDEVPKLTYLLNESNGTGSKETSTYGEQVTRKTNINLWENNGSEYFQMEYGIGFYEYFLLCESLQASALPVVNCGLSCQGQAYPGAKLAGRHGNNIEDYIQDAADLIEFAKGDKTTTWGKIRASLGHEEPFEMHYIGIGNEQWNTGNAASDYYTSYYEKFLESEVFQAACEKYDVQPIVGNHQQLQNCEGYDASVANNPWGQGKDATGGDARNAAISYRTRTGNIQTLGEYGLQDHHYYNSPIDFLLHTHLYDNYTRTGNDRYEVFVGEYSANNAFSYAGNYGGLYKENGWLSALSEAAMMTGFERNGDIVRLAAYAPMFANLTGARHWAVDMMLYTNTELVRTPNYFVQQVFMHNTGTRKVVSELAYAEDFAQTVEFSGNACKTAVDRLYYVTSLDEETGDLIVKIVNVGEDNVRINVKLGRKPTGIGTVTLMDADLKDVPKLGEEVGKPRSYTVGGSDWSDGTLGLSAVGYGVTVVRIPCGK